MLASLGGLLEVVVERRVEFQLFELREPGVQDEDFQSEPLARRGILGAAKDQFRGCE